MVENLGVGVGVEVVSTDAVWAARTDTRSPYDFAYWASTFAVGESQFDYTASGESTDGTPLVSWAASQIGVAFPNTLEAALEALCGYFTVSLDCALRTRGALIVIDNQISVSLGFYDIIDIRDGHYFVRTLTTGSYGKWATARGAHLPGAKYDSPCETIPCPPPVVEYIGGE
jgi:hypothetical protein